jgi:hypothetical protein
MSQAITIRVTKNYGREAIYPADEAAETFTKLTGKKTFDRYDLNAIRELGFEIKVLATVL